MIEQLIESNSLEEINQEQTEINFWKQLDTNKKEYLKEKSKQTGKHYKPFYDSKDAEIYSLFQSQKDSFLSSFNTAKYAALRKSMGGGGGYAVPFYKLGDIGLTQIKYFNLDSNNKAAANFARFSLIRNELRELETIFSKKDTNEIKQDLINFFTEKEEHITESLDIEINKQAKKAIELLFL